MLTGMSGHRIAIAHDYLTQRGGAERVVVSLMRAFPEATVYTTLYDPDATYPEFRDRTIVTSWLNRVPLARRDHRLALPLLRSAADSLRIDADVVIASSSAWAHGFPTTGRRLVYCHSPARYLYLSEEYLGGSLWASPRGLALLALRKGLIAWDQAKARGVDKYLANSTVIAQRIKDCYGIDADVVPAPAGIDAAGTQTELASLSDWSSGYFLIVSRLLAYKNVAVAIEAFRGLEERLVVVGSGPLREKLVAQAPSNVRLVEGLSDAELRWTYAHALGLVAPSFEDYGLTPIEAATFGKPAIALRAGGYLDTVAEGTSGVFFDAPEAGAIREAVAGASRREWDAEAIKQHALKFSEQGFHERIRREVAALLPG